MTGQQTDLIDYLRYWYEHELTRLRAAERLGHNVTKDRAAILNALSGLVARFN
jgi:hypothetical protein